MKSIKTYKEFLLSFHGTDCGLIYNLPKNVRVLLYCKHGEELSACDVNETRTYYVATTKYRDPKGHFLKMLKVMDDTPHQQQFCVFSGNLWKENLNRMPDILLDEERNDFRTGLFTMPVRFNRIFLRDHYSKTDKKTYHPGEVTPIEPEIFHQQLKPFTHKKTKLPRRGFLTYFIRPFQLDKKSYASLDFVIVPENQHFSSHSELKELTKCSKICTSEFRVQQNPVMNRDSSVTNPVMNRDSSVTNPVINFDSSVINSDKLKDIRDVKAIIKYEKGKGIFLSTVVRHLCQKHPNTFITIVATVCRVYHPDLDASIRKNQDKTASVSIDEYIKKYANVDVAS